LLYSTEDRYDGVDHFWDGTDVMQPWSQPLLWKGGAASGTPPTFVNAGAMASFTVAASVTPVLPGSRVNGNVLIAPCRFCGSGAAGTVSVSGAGWVIGASVNQAVNHRATVVAYRYVDGTEAAPTFTSTLGSNTFEAQVLQYTGVVASTPFGNTTVGWFDGVNPNAFDGGANLPLRCPAMVSAHPGSVALNIAMINPLVTAAPSTPSGWTSHSTTTQAANMSDMPLPVSGTSTGAISLPDTGIANWTEFIVEVRSQ
jgi:hypothetical protein